METLNANMLNSMMNTNMISMMSMRNDVNIYQIIVGILIMNFMGFLPMIKTFCYKYITKKFNNTKKTIENKMSIKSDDTPKEILSSIQFKKKDNDLIFNAINYKVINNNNAKFLHYSNDFSVINDEEFKITEDYYCNVKNNVLTNGDDEKSNNEYIITIKSFNKTLYELKHYIDILKQEYIHEQKIN